MLGILKKSPKTGDRLTVISDVQNNLKCVSFQPGNNFWYLETINLLRRLSSELPIPRPITKYTPHFLENVI